MNFKAAVLLLACASAFAQAPGWPDLREPAPAVGGGENDAAVVVGLESYVFVPPVPGARANAKAWYDYFTRTRGVPPGNVRLLLANDATADEILDSARFAAAKAGPEGTLWFVFIGHGAPSSDGKDGLLIAVDAQQKAKSLEHNSVRRSELVKILGKSKSRAIRVVLDACFSGRGADGSPLVPGLQPLVVVPGGGAADPRMVVMTAAASDQFAGNLPGTQRPAFSYLVLGGLRGWASHGAVTAGEVWRFASDALSATLRGRSQTPELDGATDAAMGPSAGERAPDLIELAKETAGAARAKSAPPDPKRVKARDADWIMVSGLVADAAIPLPERERVARPFLTDYSTDPGLTPEMQLALAPYIVTKRRRKTPVGADAPEARDATEIRWVDLPGGAFMMGSGTRDEAPKHRVQVPPFQLAKTELTNAQFGACVSAGACQAPHYRDGTCLSWKKSKWLLAPLPPGREDDEMPVGCLDENQVKAFLEWSHTRLPSEAEWEYAARGAGEDRRYPWGDQGPDCGKAVMASPGGLGCGRGTVWPVCSKPAGNTKQGLCDMAGNVWERTADAYHDSYAGAPSDGRPWSGPADGDRVDRGGASRSPARDLRTTYRNFSNPKERDHALGLRPAR